MEGGVFSQTDVSGSVGRESILLNSKEITTFRTYQFHYVKVSVQPSAFSSQLPDWKACILLAES